MKTFRDPMDGPFNNPLEHPNQSVIDPPFGYFLRGYSKSRNEYYSFKQAPFLDRLEKINPNYSLEVVTFNETHLL